MPLERIGKTDMKTIRENYMELLNTGHSQRLVKQYEPFAFVAGDPLLKQEKGGRVQGRDVPDAWGTVIRWKTGEHAGMPYITEENKVCPDVTQWRKYVKASNLEFPAAVFPVLSLRLLMVFLSLFSRESMKELTKRLRGSIRKDSQSFFELTAARHYF